MGREQVARPVDVIPASLGPHARSDDPLDGRAQVFGVLRQLEEVIDLPPLHAGLTAGPRDELLGRGEVLLCFPEFDADLDVDG